MRILSLYNEITKKLLEANLRNLYTKSVNETPKMAARGSQLQDQVRYFGLSEDGTLNFKVRSQTVPGRYHYAYIEAPDIIKFSDIVEEGGTFNEADLSRLLTMDGFRVLCNCQAFLYWSLKYIATQNNYDIEPETRAPKRNNTLLKGALDKHLIAVVYNLYNNKSMRQLIAKDINNYLRMLANMDYEDYQQLNHARQVKQQNRAVKWKDSPSDYMNNYFARQAKHHPFLDDHDIKHSLKLEINKYLKSHPDASTDDFLRSYFNMTQKAFAEDMELPENSITDYFNELGFSEKKDKIQEKRNNQNSNNGLDAGILTKDSESIIKESADLSKLSYTPEERQNVINKTKSNMQSHRLSKYIEFVDIDYVDAIKEYDRELTPSHSDEGLLKLFNQIKENGITEPLMICFNPYTGDIYLGEGNHRLMFAKLLKLEEVPCYCVRNERFSLGKHSINPDNITPIQDDKDFGRYYANPMKPSMLGEPFGPNYDGHLLKESYAYADDVTNEELNNNKCKFVIYGPRGSQEIEFNNLKELFQYIDDCGGLNQFRGLRWFILSNYKNGEFYYVRDSYAKGGWKWEDVNGNPVKFEYRSVRKNESDTTNLLETVILYRGSSSDEFNTDYGSFYATNKTDAQNYGDKVYKVKLSDNAKIFKGTNSINYCKDNNLLNIEFPDVEKLTGLKTLQEVYDVYLNWITPSYLNKNPNLYFLAFQKVAKDSLNSKGYDGAEWTNEDELIPHQFQIWNPSAVTTLSINESNFLNTLEPHIENDYSDLKTVEYYKDQIQKGNHRPILINRNKEILDGNHTMTAYQELGIEPPLVYQAERSQFYKAAIDHRGDALEAINQLIKDGTATKLSESEQKTYLTPDEAHKQYQDYLTGHIDNVKKMVNLIIDTCTDNQFIQEEKETLRNIAEHHDESKYSDAEYFPYLRHFYPTRPEDEAKTEEFEQACRHHILHNKHHWDYWIDPNTLELRDIPEDDREYKLYCVERVADWLSMAAQHNEDKLHWYENNKDSIKMPDWAFKFVDYIFSKLPDDFYLSADFKGTRGELDESKK